MGDDETTAWSGSEEFLVSPAPGPRRHSVPDFDPEPGSDAETTFEAGPPPRRRLGWKVAAWVAAVGVACLLWRPWAGDGETAVAAGRDGRALLVATPAVLDEMVALIEPVNRFDRAAVARSLQIVREGLAWSVPNGTALAIRGGDDSLARVEVRAGPHAGKVGWVRRSDLDRPH